MVNSLSTSDVCYGMQKPKQKKQSGSLYGSEMAKFLHAEQKIQSL